MRFRILIFSLAMALLPRPSEAFNFRALCRLVFKGAEKEIPLDPAVAANMKGVREGYADPSFSHPPTEPNAFYDTDFFGWGFQDRRPATAYSVQSVSPGGKYQSTRVAYETDWGALFPGVRQGKEVSGSQRLPLLVAQRERSTSIRLPDQLTPEGKQLVIKSEIALGREGRPLLFFERNYTKPEAEILANLNELAANYRAYLYRHHSNLKQAAQTSQEVKAEREAIAEQVKELWLFHKIEVPPNAEGLMFQGEGAPPPPTHAILHALSAQSFSGRKRYALHQKDNGKYEFVEIERVTAGAEPSYVMRSLEGYGKSSVSVTFEFAASPGEITPLFPADKEPIGKPIRLSETEFNNSKFWSVQL